MKGLKNAARFAILNMQIFPLITVPISHERWNRNRSDFSDFNEAAPVSVRFLECVFSGWRVGGI